MHIPPDAENKTAMKAFVRRPLFVTVLSVVVLATSGFVGYRQMTAVRFAPVLEVRDVSDDTGEAAFDIYVTGWATRKT